MANYLGIMSVKLGADYATLQSDLGKAAMLNARYAQDMEKQFHEAGVKIGRALSIGAAAAATAITAIVKSSIDSADQLSKLSQKVGITTESLSALKMQASRPRTLRTCQQHRPEELRSISASRSHQ